jgi:4-amino-4-deoxy-L-arabinose transferase and related glycosyltransferases of PMT family
MGRASPVQAVTCLIVAGTLLRLILAGAIGLGVDETYAASMARNLSLSYFDHPPLHFWLIWLTAHITGSESPFVLRLPFIALFGGATWLMFRLGERLFGSWAGFWAAAALNLSAVFSLSTGSWLLPDGPLVFCLLAATHPLLSLLFGKPKNPHVLWLTAGFWLGLGLLSKYHAIFWVLGTGLFVLTSRRFRLFFTPGPYLALLVAGLIFSPVIIWNAENGWVSFLFQGGRGAFTGFFPGRMLANIAGQAAWVLPWIWLPLVWAAATALRREAPAQAGSRQQRRWLLCCLAVGPIALFTLATLWGAQGLFHWQAPGYLFLFPLLGEAIAFNIRRRLVRRWAAGSLACFLAIALLLGSHTATGWLKSIAPSLFAAGDPTVEALDWRELPALVENLPPAGQISFIATRHWIDAAKIDYALGGRIPILCLSNSPHHFAFQHGTNSYIGGDALLIGRQDIIGDAAVYRPYFSSITPLGTAAIHRGDHTEIALAVFHARGFKGYPLPFGH